MTCSHQLRINTLNSWVITTEEGEEYIITDNDEPSYELALMKRDDLNDFEKMVILEYAALKPKLFIEEHVSGDLTIKETIIGSSYQ